MCLQKRNIWKKVRNFSSKIQSNISFLNIPKLVAIQLRIRYFKIRLSTAWENYQRYSKYKITLHKV